MHGITVSGATSAARHSIAYLCVGRTLTRPPSIDLACTMQHNLYSTQTELTRRKLRQTSEQYNAIFCHQPASEATGWFGAVLVCQRKILIPQHEIVLHMFHGSSLRITRVEQSDDFVRNARTNAFFTLYQMRARRSILRGIVVVHECRFARMRSENKS